MPLSSYERQKIVRMLDDMDAQKQRSILASVESFGRWLRTIVGIVYDGLQLIILFGQVVASVLG